MGSVFLSYTSTTTRDTGRAEKATYLCGAALCFLSWSFCHCVRIYVCLCMCSFVLAPSLGCGKLACVPESLAK